MQARILFLDCETAPTLAYVWRRFKENISLDQVERDGFMLCASWKWLGNPEVYSCGNIEFGQHDNDEALANVLWKVLDEADIVVAHNGKSFDVPVINASMLYHKLPPPSPYKIVDTKEVAKRIFRFPSNKAEGICSWLGMGHKHKTDFDLWKRCYYGDKVAWDKMMRYCRHDVELLEKMYKKLLPWMGSMHPNVGLFEDRPCCPKCGADGKNVVWEGKRVYRTPTQIYQSFSCKKCGGWSRGLRSILTKERRDRMTISV